LFYYATNIGNEFITYKLLKNFLLPSSLPLPLHRSIPICQHLNRHLLQLLLLLKQEQTPASISMYLREKTSWLESKYPYCVWEYNKRVGWRNKPVSWCAYCSGGGKRGSWIWAESLSSPDIVFVLSRRHVVTLEG